MNPATGDLLDELEGGAGARKPKDINTPSSEKAAKKVIKGENGEVGIPIEYLTACLNEAGRHVKFDGKKMIANKEQTLLFLIMSIDAQFFPFANQAEPMITDRRRGVIPANGIACCVVRPKFANWDFEVPITIDLDEVSEDKVKLLFEKAGAVAGLGDFRPAKKGPFGRFRVVKWESHLMAA